jgi:hypothetical protein
MSALNRAKGENFETCNYCRCLHTSVSPELAALALTVAQNTEVLSVQGSAMLTQLLLLQAAGQSHV